MLSTMICSLFAAAFGFIACAVLSGKPCDDCNEYVPDKHMQMEEHKLKRHDLRVGILKDRVIESPQETVERIKKEFAVELYNIIHENMIVEEDKKRGFINYTISVWTLDQEAADDR